MKLKKVSTKQFAGIRGKDISFNSGINVVFGRNETGKSTLVKLILSTLFKDVAVGTKSKLDKEFRADAFPAARKDGRKLDAVNGAVVIEAADGDYTLEKDWSKHDAELTAPDGAGTRDTDNINEILKPILGYGEGVYREILISPRDRAAEQLQKILDPKTDSDTRETLTQKVTEAFAQSEGISVETLEKRINEKIDKLSSHWDIGHGAPEYKKGSRWKKEVGDVPAAYYALEDAENELNELNRLEQDFDTAQRYHSAVEADEKKAVSEDHEFDRYYNTIITVRAAEEKAGRLENDIKHFKEALEKYPVSKTAHEKALRLGKELDDRVLLDRRKKARAIADELAKIEVELKTVSCPEKAEIEELKAAKDDIPLLKKQLGGMKIDAKIKMLGGNTIKLTSLVTGEEIHISDTTHISEAVRAEIPGVMEMELTPAEVNAAAINAKISELEGVTRDIFAKYGCASVEEAEKLSDRYKEMKAREQTAKRDLDAAAGSDLAGLEEQTKDLGDVRAKTDIERDIEKLCGGVDINRFIGSRETEINNFENNYGSEDELNKRIGEYSSELEKAKKTIADAGEIPEEYHGIKDPEAHKDALKHSADVLREKEKAALEKATAAKTELETFTRNHDDDLLEKRDRAKADFERQKKLLDQWMHIREVFEKEKQSLASNPLDGLVNSFVRNLSIISNKSVSAEFDKAGDVNFNITNDTYTLDFFKLSDGTKETVYLAFRLAVLDYLFPDGGGIIVLDDPLNDMDIDRVKQSCELIKNAAERHQVIFLTCRDEYIDLLNGNLIRI